MSPKLRADTPQFEATPIGFYAYHTPPEAPHQYRLHLRVLPDGDGILIINAASIIRLNTTGTFFAWASMQSDKEEDVLNRIQERYKHETPSLLKSDYRNFIAEILNIVNNPDQAPVIISSGFDNPEEKDLAKIPMRVNLCLTYRKNEAEYPIPEKELSTEEWVQIIRKTFEAGIPQVVFFGGEPTVRKDLLALLAYTEELGLVSGLITSSPIVIEEPGYLTQINEIGLDHLVLEIDPEAVIANDLRHIFDQDLFSCIRFGVKDGADLLERALSLAQSGANALSLYPLDIVAAQTTSNLHQQLVNHGVLIEQDMPLPLNTNSISEIHLFSPELNEPIMDYSLTVLPDGTVCLQEDLNSQFGNINLQDWGTLLSNHNTSEE